MKHEPGQEHQPWGSIGSRAQSLGRSCTGSQWWSALQAEGLQASKQATPEEEDQLNIKHVTVELKRRHTCRPLTKSNGLRFLTGIVFFWSQRSLRSVWGKHRDLKFHHNTGKTLRYLLFQRKSAARSTAARPQAFQKPALSSGCCRSHPHSESHAHYNHTGLCQRCEVSVVFPPKPLHLLKSGLQPRPSAPGLSSPIWSASETNLMEGSLTLLLKSGRFWALSDVPVCYSDSISFTFLLFPSKGFWLVPCLRYFFNVFIYFTLFCHL